MGTVHVHWYYNGVDCDGRLERTAVGEHEGHTMEEVLLDIVKAQYHVHGDGKMFGAYARLGRSDDEYEHQRSLEVKPVFDAKYIGDDENGEPLHELEFIAWEITTGAPHEEGGSSEVFTVCALDQCDLNLPLRQRDHSAEAMGY